MEKTLYDQKRYFNRLWFEHVKENLLTQGELIENLKLNPIVKTDLENSDRFINSNYEQTDLRLAILYGFTDVIDYLIKERGDDLNDLDCYGNNVLMYSFRNKSLSMTDYLLKNYSELIDFSIINYSDRDVIFELLSKIGSKHFIDPHYIEQHKSINFLNPEKKGEVISLYDLYEKSNMYNFEENDNLLSVLDLLIEKTKGTNRLDKYGYDVILYVAMSNVRLLPYFISKGYKYDSVIKNSMLFVSNWKNMITTFPLPEIKKEEGIVFFSDFSSFIFQVEYLQKVEKDYLYNQCMKEIFLIKK